MVVGPGITGFSAAIALSYHGRHFSVDDLSRFSKATGAATHTVWLVNLPDSTLIGRDDCGLLKWLWNINISASETSCLAQI